MEQQLKIRAGCNRSFIDLITKNYESVALGKILCKLREGLF